ncbi:MAG: hypothetical protein KDE11_03095 [Rhodobacteraceae bacterium]|nr:hypothetical protein [Paracoccaceae bacterium]
MANELARITPSAMRRLIAVATLAFVGILLITIAFIRSPADFSSAVFLLSAGVLALGLGVVFHRVSRCGLVLSEEELRDTSGRLLAKVADIRRVERGFLAFRPSNGFSLHLTVAGTRAWVPGLWWRFGRRIGVGGIISGAEGRAMADLIAALVLRRDDEAPRPG